MKKFILILLIILILPVFVTSKAYSKDVLTSIENTVFGYDYKNESESTRVERIERYLYGDKKNGSINTRIKSIENDIGFVDTVPKGDMPQKTFANDVQNNKLKNNIKPEMNNEIMGLKEDSSVEYPIVDKMEQEVFNTTFRSEDIYKRLDRLEKQLFNETTDSSLNERVERLSMKVNPVRKTRKMTSYSPEELNDYYTNSGLEQINDQSMPFQLAVLEEDLLKNNYGNDNVSNRLSRLEQRLFKRTFTTDNDISRLQRIMVAYDAKKNSYKYENNKKMQNMAAASQIGGILLMILAILL